MEIHHPDASASVLFKTLSDDVRAGEPMAVCGILLVLVAIISLATAVLSCVSSSWHRAHSWWIDRTIAKNRLAAATLVQKED